MYPSAGQSRRECSKPFGAYRYKTLRQCKTLMTIGEVWGKIWKSKFVRFKDGALSGEGERVTKAKTTNCRPWEKGSAEIGSDRPILMAGRGVPASIH
ncbi:hypothetical protein AVEN_105211-1 [Araneus ventricosus]|uniref:Uncharacterized protein n=1 Tax=Araneus ventricosus TaxID=182803 RepID=A0A4Y2VLU8_ARAVE|nr:hypothetical protein AVEN_105211-1 [Araneus ventricosus]